LRSPITLSCSLSRREASAKRRFVGQKVTPGVTCFAPVASIAYHIPTISSDAATDGRCMTVAIVCLVLVAMCGPAWSQPAKPATASWKQKEWICEIPRGSLDLKWSAVAFRLSPSGDPQCLSLDGRSCWKDSQQTCYDKVESPGKPTTTLTCGAQHKKIWGVTGYEDKSHWCSVVRGFYANPSEFCKQSQKQALWYASAKACRLASGRAGGEYCCRSEQCASGE
jgi:hypothetical protein